MLTASDGKVERAIEMSFDDQLRHHIDLAFAVCEDISVLRTRNRPAMANFVQNLCHGYRLPDERTLKKVLDAITEAQLRCQMGLIAGAHKAAKNGPAFGIQLDLWTKRKLRDAFMSLRSSPRTSSPTCAPTTTCS